MLIHLVADYGPGDLAFAEVIQQLARHLPEATVVATPVPAFDTLSAGFCVGQLARTDGPADRIVYHNVAPRADSDQPRPGNAGERLLAARLSSGVLVVGASSTYAFSFVRDAASEIREVMLPESGSQFRSRDVFPALLADLVHGDDGKLGRPVEPDSLPAVPERTIIYVDGYGNLKTSWTQPPAPSGEQVLVRIGAATKPATVSNGTFDVPAGDIAFAPGSSGWDGRPFYELLARGASAAELFGGPAAGGTVELTAR